MNDVTRRQFLEIGTAAVAGAATARPGQAAAPSPQVVPFTRGRWKTTPPLGIVHM